MQSKPGFLGGAKEKSLGVITQKATVWGTELYFAQQSPALSNCAPVIPPSDTSVGPGVHPQGSSIIYSICGSGTCSCTLLIVWN